MNNLVKPLQWEEINKKYSLWTAKFPGIPFFSYKTLWFMDEFRCCFEHNFHDVHSKLWEEMGFSTIEEAKAACDKHYEDFVGSLLSHNLLRTLVEHNYNF